MFYLNVKSSVVRFQCWHARLIKRTDIQIHVLWSVIEKDCHCVECWCRCKVKGKTFNQSTSTLIWLYPGFKLSHIFYFCRLQVTSHRRATRRRGPNSWLPTSSMLQVERRPRFFQTYLCISCLHACILFLTSFPTHVKFYFHGLAAAKEIMLKMTITR